MGFRGSDTPTATGWQTMHVSRSWPNSGTPIEDECPCPQELCGHVAWEKIDPDCPQHTGAKTIRSGHTPEYCPRRRVDAAHAAREALEGP